MRNRFQPPKNCWTGWIGSNDWAIFSKRRQWTQNSISKWKKKLKRDEEDATWTTAGRSGHGSHRVLAIVRSHYRWSSASPLLVFVMASGWEIGSAFGWIWLCREIKRKRGRRKKMEEQEGRGTIFSFVFSNKIVQPLPFSNARFSFIWVDILVGLGFFGPN